jgi:hypothetical protein
MHYLRIISGNVLRKESRADSGAQSGCGDVVFDSDWEPIQATILGSGLDALIRELRLLTCGVRRYGDEGTYGVVIPFNAPEVGVE